MIKLPFASKLPFRASCGEGSAYRRYLCIAPKLYGCSAVHLANEHVDAVYGALMFVHRLAAAVVLTLKEDHP